MAARAPIARFLEKYKADESGCWLWTASRGTGGYGQFFFRGTMVGAHCFSYEHHVGPVAKGLTLDHLCRVRHCVNPAHLEPVTRGENVLRGENFMADRNRQTHCERGHEMAGIRADGRRRCLVCYGEAKKTWETENRERRTQQRAASRKRGAAAITTAAP